VNKAQNLHTRVRNAKSKAKQRLSSRRLLALLIFFSCLFLLYTAFVLDRYFFHFTETFTEENAINSSKEIKKVKKSGASILETAEPQLHFRKAESPPFFQHDSTPVYKKKAVSQQGTNIAQKGGALLPVDVTNPKHVEWLVVNSGIVHFYQAKKRYPISLEELARPYPNNWISYVPKGITYKRTNRSYTLFLAGTSLDARKGLVEILVYPSAHKLALSFHGRPIAVYPAAIGKKGMPFSSSYVTERVVEPNGPGSPFGTRGLVLEQEVAIHGTNKLSSVGRSVSAGCFRLFNHHIEELYPFVPKGTLLKISDGAPAALSLPGGIPLVLTEKSLESEKNLGTRYNWRR
jgi:hypothetical protein